MKKEVAVMKNLLQLLLFLLYNLNLFKKVILYNLNSIIYKQKKGSVNNPRY